MSTTQLGDIKMKIGEFANKETGKQSPKSITIGKLMMTDHSDGTRRIWGKLHLHILHASLYAMARPYVDKGETEFSINVFRDDKPAPANQGGQSTAAPPAGAADDEYPGF